MNALVSPPPQTAVRLAYAGLLPFGFGTALAWLLSRPEDLEAHAHVMRGLSLYASIVISFLGAVHWGLLMRESDPAPTAWRWAVLPGLLAWPAALMPAYAGLVVHGVLLIACYAVDRQRYAALGLTPWLTLRFRCTVGASLACFLAAAAT